MTACTERGFRPGALAREGSIVDNITDHPPRAVYGLHPPRTLPIRGPRAAHNTRDHTVTLAHIVRALYGF